MTLDLRYVRAFDLSEPFVDKDTGLPLSSGIVTFYQDSQPTTKKSVYQITGTSPNYTFVELPNPMILSSIGTFQDTLGNQIMIYYYPYDNEGDVDLYYVTVESSGNVEQFVRYATPGGISATTTGAGQTSFENQLSNPQFVDVLFPEAYYSTPTSHTYSVSPSVTTSSVAPGWDIVTTGTGSVTVERVTLPASVNSAVVSNPCYGLKITTSSGITAKLRQRLDQSPAFLAGQFANVYFAIATYDGADHSMSMQFATSDGTTTTLKVANTGTVNDVYTANTASVLIPTPYNTDSAIAGYVDVQITIPASSVIGITSISLCGTPEAQTAIAYTETPVARQQDQLAHYYKPQLAQKPIKSILIGWDFPANLVQFLGPTVSGASYSPAPGANKSFYAWDQTIVFQSASGGASITRASGTDALELSAAATTQLALVQYLQDPSSYLLNPLCVNIAAYSNKAAGIGCVVSLWYTTAASLPNVKSSTYNSIVASLNADGSVNTTNFVTTDWTEIPRRNNLGKATFKVQEKVDENFFDYNFNGWDLDGDAGIPNATFFAIVIGTESMATSDKITFLSVGMMNGDIATRPAPLTYNELKSQQEIYYEKSNQPGVVPGTANTQGQCVLYGFNLYTGALSDAVYLKSFMIRFANIKVNNPVITLYSPTTGASASFDIRVNRQGAYLGPYTTGSVTNLVASNYDVTSFVSLVSVYVVALKTTSTIATLNSGDPGDDGLLIFHYVADARLGTF